MKYRTLGRTGIQVSEIGLGCEHLQGLGEEEVFAVVDEAIRCGVNLLDVFMCERTLVRRCRAAAAGCCCRGTCAPPGWTGNIAGTGTWITASFSLRTLWSASVLIM